MPEFLLLAQFLAINLLFASVSTFTSTYLCESQKHKEGCYERILLSGVRSSCCHYCLQSSSIFVSNVEIPVVSQWCQSFYDHRVHRWLLCRTSGSCQTLRTTWYSGMSYYANQPLYITKVRGYVSTL